MPIRAAIRSSAGRIARGAARASIASSPRLGRAPISP
jgi:hypothetical protein